MFKPDPNVAPAAYCLLSMFPLENTFRGKFAKFCRHVGTAESDIHAPASEYKVTLPSVVMVEPPTVMRSISGKIK